MFHEMIKRKRDAWIARPDCPVRETIQYMLERPKSGAGLREIQVDAIKTYLFLKIACGARPLAKLFSEGTFSSLDLNAVPLSSTARTYLAAHPASAALLEFALQKEEDAKDVLAPDLAKVLKESPEKINAEDVFGQIFYRVSYPDYLFSLPMGAGKTYLMAAFMYLDLMLITIEKFDSDRVRGKIAEFNERCFLNQKPGKKFKEIKVSEERLEMIESVSVDCTSKTGAWHSDTEILIDKFGLVRLNGAKTNKYWVGTIACSKKPIRLRLRNICGDETVVVL